MLKCHIYFLCKTEYIYKFVTGSSKIRGFIIFVQFPYLTERFCMSYCRKGFLTFIENFCQFFMDTVYWLKSKNSSGLPMIYILHSTKEKYVR